MQYFTIVLGQLFSFMIFIFIGVIAIKKNVFDEKGLQVLSNLIIKITMPIMLFCNTINGSTKKEFIATMPILLLAILMYFILFFICHILRFTFKLEGNKAKVYHASTMFGNVGFMGIPILLAIFPENGMLYIALFTIIDQLLLWTLGIRLTSGEENQSGNVLKRLQKLINPATIAIVMAVIGIFADLRLPILLNDALVSIGNITSPLAMIYLGGLFCFIDIKSSFKQVEFYAAILIKMCIFPVLFYIITGYIPNLSIDMRFAISIISAMPTMSSVAMLAKAQNSEGEYSAGQVFLTTCMSVITLPCVCYLISIL